MTNFRYSNFGKSIFGLSILGSAFLGIKFWGSNFRSRLFGSRYEHTGFTPALMGLMRRTAAPVDNERVHDTLTQESEELLEMFERLRSLRGRVPAVQPYVLMQRGDGTYENVMPAPVVRVRRINRDI